MLVYQLKVVERRELNNITKQTVLIVDDQESIRLALSRMLSKEGYEVLLADEGEKALDVLREKKVNVMLSDLKMPKMEWVAAA